MAAGRKTGGRKKGSLNKTTRLAKEAIAEAFDRIGGVDRLVAWIGEDAQNERIFMGQVYPKLLPLQVDAEHTGEVVAKVVFKGLNG